MKEVMFMADALAIVECISLPTAIAFADAAVKAADVNLIGYELPKGAGLVTVKLSGNVSAVKAAAEAGIALAKTITGVAGYTIIPRPSEYLDVLIRNGETIGYEVEPPFPHAAVNDEPQEQAGPEAATDTNSLEDKPLKTGVNAEPLPPNSLIYVEDKTLLESTEQTEEEPGKDEAMAVQRDSALMNPEADVTELAEVTCNLCGDPKCPRCKGEPRNSCIHIVER